MEKKLTTFEREECKHY